MGDRFAWEFIDALLVAIRARVETSLGEGVTAQVAPNSGQGWDSAHRARLVGQDAAVDQLVVMDRGQRLAGDRECARRCRLCQFRGAEPSDCDIVGCLTSRPANNIDLYFALGFGFATAARWCTSRQQQKG
jgi:hypothetical protein